MFVKHHQLVFSLSFFWKLLEKLSFSKRNALIVIPVMITNMIC